MGRLILRPAVLEDGHAWRTPIAAWRFDGNSGLARASAGFPCTPGLVTDENLSKIRLFIDGIEQAIALDPARGKHPDLSYRSVRIQFRTVVSKVPRRGEIRIGTVDRRTTDLEWIEPTYGVPAGQDATNWPAVSQNCVFACTDPVHLCNSYVALEPLQPQSMDSETSRAYFGVETGSEFDDWIEWLDEQTPSATFASTYEHVYALQEAYVRSGSLRMYERAHIWLVAQLGSGDYFKVHPSQQTTGGNNYDLVQAWDPTLPETSDAGVSGLPNEQNSGGRFGWATGYLLSGWQQPALFSAYHLSWQGQGASFALTDEWLPRFNIRMGGLPLITAYQIGANLQIGSGNEGYGAGRDPSVRTFAGQLPTILTTLATHAYDNYLSGFADGAVGMKQTADDGGNPVVDPPGSFPLFQQQFTADILVRYYGGIAPDSWIPVALKRAADIIIAQGTPTSDTAEWPYVLTDDEGDPPPSPGDQTGNKAWAPFFIKLFGFMYAYETDPTDKATYLEWLDRAMNPASLAGFAKNGKAFGEYFGAQQSGAFYRDGGAVRGIAGAHPTTIIEPPIWSS